MFKCAVLQLLQVIRWFSAPCLWKKKIKKHEFLYHLSIFFYDKLSLCKQFWVFIWDALSWLFFIPFVQKSQLIFHTFFWVFTSLNLFLDICLFSYVSSQKIAFSNNTLWTWAENHAQPYYMSYKNTILWTFFAGSFTTKYQQWLQSATPNYNNMKNFQGQSVLDQFKKGTQEGVKGNHQGLTM